MKAHDQACSNAQETDDHNEHDRDRLEKITSNGRDSPLDRLKPDGALKLDARRCGASPPLPLLLRAVFTSAAEFPRVR